MSKLSKLKQEAFQAAKKRDWDSAVSVYERILDLDKNNPTLINELGDICLKKGDLPRAITHFLGAAAKYRTTGLQNNAVAIYKKILRHEPENLNAHWYLAEIRAGQGLSVEGEKHAVAFLSSSSNLSAEVKDIFLKRCIQLFSLYPSSFDILDQLQGVFRLWSMLLEEARVACLLACLNFDAGQQDEAELNVNAALEKVPEVANYPEYQAWSQKLDPNIELGHPADVNSLSLDGGAKPGKPDDGFVTFTLGEAETTSDTGESPAVDEISFAKEGTGTAGTQQPEASDSEQPGQPAASFDDLMHGIDGGTAPPPPSQSADTAQRDEGRFEIEVDDNTSLDDLLGESESAVEKMESATVQTGTAAGDQTGLAEQDTRQEGSVDLLAEILADGEMDLAADAAGQVDTIASEIGQQVGGEGASDDAKSQYEMGMVYLEMGLYDQACECFGSAAQDSEYAHRSYEMWGITLRRQEHVDEAITMLAHGLELPAAEPQDQLGLIYHTGRAHEQAGRLDEARQWYERAYAISPNFLDIQQRLATQAPV